jgi:hypothetical protein
LLTPQQVLSLIDLKPDCLSELENVYWFTFIVQRMKEDDVCFLVRGLLHRGYNPSLTTSQLGINLLHRALDSHLSLAALDQLLSQCPLLYAQNSLETVDKSPFFGSFPYHISYRRHQHYGNVMKIYLKYIDRSWPWIKPNNNWRFLRDHWIGNMDLFLEAQLLIPPGIELFKALEETTKQTKEEKKQKHQHQHQYKHKYQKKQKQNLKQKQRSEKQESILTCLTPYSQVRVGLMLFTCKSQQQQELWYCRDLVEVIAGYIVTRQNETRAYNIIKTFETKYG